MSVLAGLSCPLSTSIYADAQLGACGMWQEALCRTASHWQWFKTIWSQQQLVQRVGLLLWLHHLGNIM